MKPDAIAPSAGVTDVSQPRFFNRPLRPAMMPQPMRAGISGTKMFAIFRRKSLNGVAFFAFRAALIAAPCAASSAAAVVAVPVAAADSTEVAGSGRLRDPPQPASRTPG